MKRLTANIIGAGKVGKTLGYLLNCEKTLHIQGIHSLSYANALGAMHFIGGGFVCEQLTDLPPADITFIVVPDANITPCVDAAVAANIFTPNSIVLHCSGALSSDALHSAQAAGLHTMSLHPLHSFANPSLSIRHFKGTPCAIEGDAHACATIQPLFEAIGCEVFEIDKRAKGIYHAAGVFASNYVITLADLAKSCLTQANIESDRAIDLVIELMQSTVNNLRQSRSPDAALTGPIARGDLNTLETHMQAFDSQPMLQAIYAALGTLTLELAALPPEKQAALKTLFSLTPA